jgi:hypothetical protein
LNCVSEHSNAGEFLCKPMKEKRGRLGTMIAWGVAEAIYGAL